SKQPEERYPTWAHFALELARVGRLTMRKREVPDSERFAALRKSELFIGLNDAQTWELVHASRWTRFPLGSVVIREDEPGQSLFLLVQGTLKVSKQERTLNVLEAGACFGEMAYVGDGMHPRHATVQSMTEVLVVEFDNTALARMSDRCQLQFSRGLLR